MSSPGCTCAQDPCIQWEYKGSQPRMHRPGAQVVHRWFRTGAHRVRSGWCALGAHACGTTTAVASCTPAEQPWLYMAIYPLLLWGIQGGPSPGCTGLVHRWCTGGSAPVRTECAAGGAHTCGTTAAVTCCTPAEQPLLYMAIYPCYSSRNTRGSCPC